ncbi:MAG: sigma-70 family RNA polymerase sigma factor [Emcibacter sp.]|nr:sigma-70 family RNA polymerase sigma factor [Emcibacter sp.]
MKLKPKLRLVSVKSKNPAVEGCHHDEITELYQEYNETLVRYLTIRLRSRQDAVEVAQEAYIRLLRRDNLDDIDCFQSFLFRTATNISIDLQRHRTRQNINFAKSKILFGNIDEITPERALGARQTLDELRKALEELPPKCKEAFMLYKFKNMSHTEIAEKMDLSVSSIRKYIARGLAFCIQKIGD